MAHKLSTLLSGARSTVFLGGAGVSTESGIPDFRSAEGAQQVLERYAHPPETLLSRAFFLEHPDVFYSYYRKHLLHPEAAPGPAHRALAQLEAAGKLDAVVTQNVDGLHQAAGSRNVFELHGSAERNYCMNCGAVYPLAYILDPERARGFVPLCTRCGGTVRPDVVLYGENLDDAVVAGAVRSIRNADLLIVGGTSLVVYPAAGLLKEFHGEHLVLINRDETPFDNRAELVIRDSIGAVLSAAVAQLAC